MSDQATPQQIEEWRGMAAGVIGYEYAVPIVVTWAKRTLAVIATLEAAEEECARLRAQNETLRKQWQADGVKLHFTETLVDDWMALAVAAEQRAGELEVALRDAGELLQQYRQRIIELAAHRPLTDEDREAMKQDPWEAIRAALTRAAPNPHKDCPACNGTGQPTHHTCKGRA